jgi:energy-coupling factor transporter ATP-binding protein EcfA2
MILLQTKIEGTSYQLTTLPGQAFEKKLTRSIEDLKITGPIAEFAKFPLGTVFIADKYEFPEDDHLHIVSDTVTGLFFNSSVFPISALGEEKIQEVCDFTIDYMIDSGRYDLEKEVQPLANQFASYGYNFDWDAKVTPKPIEEGSMPAGTNIKRTIAAHYPVPKREDCGFHIDPDIWFLMVRNVLRGENTLLVGPTGSGKTEILVHLAKAMGKELYTQDMGTVQDAQSALLGVHRINILFPCLDKRRYLPIDVACDEGDRTVSVAEGTVFFATANLGSEYSGTQAIDRALLDRFFPIELDYPKLEDEVKILMLRTGVDEKVATAIVKVSNEIRKQYKEQELSSAISVRHTLQAASLVSDGFEIDKALLSTIMPLFEDGIGVSERSKVLSIVSAF